MDIRLHIGAHRSATQHLRQMLVKNRDHLEEQGICLPDAEVAEKAFATALAGVRAEHPIDQVNAVLMSALTKDKEYRRIVLIDPNISGTVLRPVGREYFYPRIGNAVSRMQTMLDGLPMRLFVSVRNPASFIPSCYAESLRLSTKASFDTYIEETNLQRLRWSDFLHRAQMKKEEMPVTTWRYEDYPFMWRDVAQAITGIPNKELLIGDPAPVNKGISLRGAILMHTYLKDHPVSTKEQFNRIRKVFEEKYPSVENEVYNPTWPAELTMGMSENYEDDWYYIERMENVETIQPRVYS